jgi:tetratricopeptide (TPR) repeat protein
MPTEERRRRTPPAPPRPDAAEVLAEIKKFNFEPERYVAAIRDWVEKGSNSVWAMPPEKVLERSGGRSLENAQAAAHFELGEHLHRLGAIDLAQKHWRQAHRLFPENWTYKRQAWEIASPGRQGRTDVYDGSWLDDVRAFGGEKYYPRLEE